MEQLPASCNNQIPITQDNKNENNDYIYTDPFTGIRIIIKDSLFKTAIDKTIEGKGKEYCSMKEVKERYLRDKMKKCDDKKPTVIEPKEDDIVI